MPDDQLLQNLRAELEVAFSERDAAVDSLERERREAEEQAKLLVEEQDRFVSHLLAAHEREMAKLRLEIDEANAGVKHHELKLIRERGAAARLEEDIGRMRMDLERLREHREKSRADLQAARLLAETQAADIERLNGDLALARSMLDDAMSGDLEPRVWISAPPSAHSYEPPPAPRESGIRRPPRRRNTPTGTMRDQTTLRPSENPRAAGTTRGSRPPR
jgi:hypothetical protein